MVPQYVPPTFPADGGNTGAAKSKAKPAPAKAETFEPAPAPVPVRLLGCSVPRAACRLYVVHGLCPGCVAPSRDVCRRLVMCQVTSPFLDPKVKEIEAREAQLRSKEVEFETVRYTRQWCPRSRRHTCSVSRRSRLRI